MSNHAPTAAAALAVLLLGGGFMGYRKGSNISLIAGLTGATVMTFTFTFLSKNAHDKTGNRIAAGTTLLLSCAMGYRYIKTRKTVPLIVSMITGLCFTFFFAPNVIF